MIYLDNAATTNYKPQRVVETVHDCLTKYPFNPNRGNNKYAYFLQEKLLETRKKLSLLYRNDGENHVVFTSGCTQALNLAILGNAKRGRIVVSATEHNSVLRPVMQLEKRGLSKVSVVQPVGGQITLDALKNVWQEDVFMLCVSHASNVNGTRQNLTELGDFAHRNGALFLVDCAQSAGYFALDMATLGVDLVALGAHKGLHGIQGAGALIFTEKSVPRPITFGGTGTESHLPYQPQTIPDGLESGTMPMPAIMAMNAGLDWWIDNWQQNDQNVCDAQSLLLDGLKSIPKVKMFSQKNKSGIVAFDVGNLDSNAVADKLQNDFDIVVRGGLQCAPLMHKYLGTFNQGVVRASVSCITTKRECFAFLGAVEEIAKHA